jgi:glycosyltransferase involved in cell wall biosynthesis
MKRLTGLARFAAKLRQARPDIIYPYLIVPNIACGLVWRWTGARTCIWNQRDSGIGRLGDRVEQRAIKRVPWFISNSINGAAFLTQTLHAPPDRVRVIHNGITLATPQADRAAWRNRLGISDDTVAACMIANLTVFKDHETLLRAWRQVLNFLKGRDQSVVLLLAGRQDSYDSTAQVLKVMVVDLELGTSVRFLGQVDDVSGLLGAADLAVFSSRSESSPNGALESMAAGLALAATDNPGIREAVGPDYEFLAPIEDADALAERIVRLVTDPSLRAEQGAANQKRIKTEFSPELMYRQTTALMIQSLRENVIESATSGSEKKGGWDRASISPLRKPATELHHGPEDL